MCQNQTALPELSSPQGPEQLPRSTTFQNGNLLLHYCGPLAELMDSQDRSEGYISYTIPPLNKNVLLVRCECSNISIPGTPIRPVHSTIGIYKDNGTSSTHAQVSRHPSPLLSE